MSEADSLSSHRHIAGLRGVRRMSERVPTTNFSASWTRVDQTSDPSFYSTLLDATRAQGARPGPART
jgi:hypothetical protein